MNILFVDDDKNRIRKFKQRSIGNLVTCVTTEAEAKIALLSDSYDLVFLDHDLIEEDYGHMGISLHQYMRLPQPRSGGRLALYIKDHADRFQKTQFVLHSLNETGREFMQMVLNSAGLKVRSQPAAWDIWEEQVWTGGAHILEFEKDD